MSKKSAPENSYPKVSEFLVTASENETVPDGILQLSRPEKVSVIIKYEHFGSKNIVLI
jgi:hypothetical protein